MRSSLTTGSAQGSRDRQPWYRWRTPSFDLRDMPQGVRCKRQWV